MPAMPAASGAQRPPVPVGYQHLIDGGPTDNLGVEALVELAASHRAALAAAGKPLPEAGCLVIVVDAYASGIANRKAWTADPRGLLDHVVDFNFLDSVDALLARRRQDLLSFLGLGTSRPPATGTSLGDFAQWGKVPNLFGFTLGPAEQWVQFDVPEGFRSGVHSWAEIRPVLRQTAPFPSPEWAELNRTGQLGKPTQLAKGHFRCAAWHLNLGGLLAIRLYAGQAGEEPHRLPNDDSGHTHPVLMQRAKLHWLVSQIETSFKLTGPDGCSSQFLQEALYAAAFVAVREDHKNRLLACDWFDKAKLALPPSCRAFPGNESTRLVLDLEPVGPLVAERYGNEQVACRNAGSGAP
jgi:NTE family protein